MRLWTRVGLTIIVCLSSVLMMGSLYVYYSFDQMQDDEIISKDPVDKDDPATEDDKEKPKDKDGITNILLIGVDDRYNSGSSSGVMADAIMIATLDTVNNKLKLTSILRDTYVEMPGYGSTKINHSHSYGGVDLLLKTIEHNFDIDIDQYAKINFGGFKEVVDILGGVEVEITSTEMLNELNRCLILEKYEDPYFKDSNFKKYVDKSNALLDRESYPGTPYIKDNPNLTEWEYNYIADKAQFVNSTGMVKLNGSQALAYSRMRHNVDGTIGRTSRQREVLSLALNKLTDLPSTKWLSLANTIVPHVKTNISVGEAIDLGFQVLDIGNLNVEQLHVPPEKLGEGTIVDKSFIYEGVNTYVYLHDKENTTKVMHDFIFEDIPYNENNYPKFNYVEHGYYAPHYQESYSDDEDDEDTSSESEDNEDNNDSSGDQDNSEDSNTDSENNSDEDESNSDNSSDDSSTEDVDNTDSDNNSGDTNTDTGEGEDSSESGNGSSEDNSEGENDTNEDTNSPSDNNSDDGSTDENGSNSSNSTNNSGSDDSQENSTEGTSTDTSNSEGNERGTNNASSENSSSDSQNSGDNSSNNSGN